MGRIQRRKESKGGQHKESKRAGKGELRMADKARRWMK